MTNLDRSSDSPNTLFGGVSLDELGYEVGDCVVTSGDCASWLKPGTKYEVLGETIDSQYGAIIKIREWRHSSREPGLIYYISPYVPSWTTRYESLKAKSLNNQEIRSSL